MPCYQGIFKLVLLYILRVVISLFNNYYNCCVVKETFYVITIKLFLRYKDKKEAVVI